MIFFFLNCSFEVNVGSIYHFHGGESSEMRASVTKQQELSDFAPCRHCVHASHVSVHITLLLHSHLVKRDKSEKSRFPGSLQVLTSTYKLNLPSKALQVLIFASWSLQV